MKSFLTIAATVTLFIVPSLASAKMSTAMELKMKIGVLKIQKRKLIEDIAINTVLACTLEDDLSVIRDYASGDLSLGKLLSQYPIVTDGGIAATMGVAARYFNFKVISPMILKDQAHIIARLAKKFPKLAKGSTWAASVAAVAAAIYYTVDRALTYGELKTKTSTQLEALYASKMSELVTRRDDLAVAVSTLLKLDHTLNEMTEAHAKEVLETE